jgi:hypothetical protein
MKNIDFQKKSNEELISIVEMPDVYIEEMVLSAIQELNKRKLPLDDKEAVAKTLFHQKCKYLFKGNLHVLNKIELPYSSILGDKLKRDILIIEFEIFKDKRRLLNFGLPRE